MSHDLRKRVKRKAVVYKEECVACGTCVKVCPKSAIAIVAGVFAQVNPEQCVGCSQCFRACPASVIEMITMEVEPPHVEVKEKNLA